MCTSIIFSPKNHYFGRNLDLDISYGQKVVITPRNYQFDFRKENSISHHFTIIGIALVANDYPLYFDAANEAGLGMAGLNYPGNAYYQETLSLTKANISPFEFIPWVLSQCSNLTEAEALIVKTNLVAINFSEKMPLASLHWLLADKTGQALVVEADRDGLHLYHNEVGVLTNNPQFPKQRFALNIYRNLSVQPTANTFASKIDLTPYSSGMGSVNLPGGLDSVSRFVRATFNLHHAPKSENNAENINTYFHILKSVEQQKGLNKLDNGQDEFTIYSDCFDLDQNCFYYTTYNNSQISQVSLAHEDLEDSNLISYSISDQPNFREVN